MSGSINFGNSNGLNFQNYTSSSKLTNDKIESAKIEAFKTHHPGEETTKKENNIHLMNRVQNVAYDSDVIKLEEEAYTNSSFNQESNRDISVEAKIAEVNKSLNAEISFDEEDEFSFGSEDLDTEKDEYEEDQKIGEAQKNLGQIIEGVGQATEEVGQATEEAGQTTEEAGQTTEEFGQETEEVGQATEEEGELESHFQSDNLVDANREKEAVAVEERSASEKKTENVEKQTILEKPIENIPNEKIVNISKEIIQNPGLEKIDEYEANDLNATKNFLKEGDVSRAEKQNRTADIKVVEKLHDAIPEIRSYLANHFIKLDDQYFSADQITKYLASKERMNQKDIPDFVDKFFQENKIYKFVDDKAVELTPEELKLFKEKFTQNFQYTIAVLNLNLFNKEQEKKAGRTEGSSQQSENDQILNANQAQNVSSRREIDPQRVRLFVIQESNMIFISRLRRIVEKAIQEFRDRLHKQHQEEIEDYAKLLIREREEIKKEQYRLDLKHTQQKVQGDHDEVLNKLVEVLLNLEEPIPPPTQEEIKYAEAQAENILPGIKLRKWSGLHSLEVGTRLVPTLVPRKVKTQARA